MRPETLKKNWEFDRVLKQGRASGATHLVVYGWRNRRPHLRVGFCVSRKVGNAVVRNKVRRRLREIFRLHRSGLKCGWDVVVLARPSAAQCGYQALQDVFLELCKKVGVWREPTA